MTLDWTDNLLRAEKGMACVSCGVEEAVPVRALTVSQAPDRVLVVCDECLGEIAHEIRRARPAVRSIVCPKCDGWGGVYCEKDEPCKLCDGQRLVLVKATKPLKVLEPFPSPDESPVVPGQEDPA